MSRGGTGVFLQNRDFFGALVIHVPLLDALRQSDPTAPLVVYSPFARGGMYTSIGLADEVVVYRAAGESLWRDLRGRRFDRIVTLRPKSFGLNALISTVGAKRTLGYASALSRLMFSHTVPRDTGIYRSINYANLLQGEVPVPPFPDAVRRLAERSRSNPHVEVRDGVRPYVLMPCGSDERKLWGESNFAALATALAGADPHARFVLVLGAGEARYVELFERAGLGERTRALIDGSLPDIARTVLGASAVVANDCGPSHVAQLSGVPLVMLFGNWDGDAPTRIAEWYYPRPGARCLTTAAHRPIASIGVDQVLAAACAVRDRPDAPAAVVEVQERAVVAT
jgi:ADP-heptose:LPS heptosyltransferase